MSQLKGCMKVFISTLQEDGLDAIYYGDWKNPRKRYKLFKKPRNYSFHIYLTDILGAKDITKLEPQGELNKMQLSETLQQQINRIIAENRHNSVVLRNSYITIRA